jgi:thioredoxin-like negative regulator of GroEL
MSPFPELDQFEFHHALADTRGPVLVFFSAPHCGACLALERALRDYLRQSPDIQVFKVDAQRDLALTREFGLFHLPAMFLYLDGEFHRELHCQATVDGLRREIHAAGRRPPQEAP